MFYKLPEFIRLDQASSVAEVCVCVCSWATQEGVFWVDLPAGKLNTCVCVRESFSHAARGVEWKYRKRIHRGKNNNAMILANNVKWHMCGAYQSERGEVGIWT